MIDVTDGTFVCVSLGGRGLTNGRVVVVGSRSCQRLSLWFLWSSHASPDGTRIDIAG